MNSTIEVSSFSHSVECSPVSQARADALNALVVRDVTSFASAMESLAFAIGAKPAKADFLSKEGFKSAMNNWNSDKSTLAEVIRAAESAGYSVKDTYSARGLKSGAVSLSHRRSVTVKHSANAWKI